MDKTLLRKKLMKVRSEITGRDEKNAIIASRALDLASRFGSVFIYVSMNSEVDTHGIIRSLEQNTKVFVPHTDKSGFMRAVMLPPSANLNETDNYGNIIRSPDSFFDGQAELSFVPLLGFDSDCHRIGYGAGCYDRYFAKFAGGLKVGLAFEEQFCKFEHDLTDIPMDIIITPDRVIRRIK